MSTPNPRSLLTHYASHPLVLDLYLIKHLGPEYYAWEPETVWQEATRVSKGHSISEVNKNKIQAVRTVHNTNLPFEEWQVFEKIIAALNGVIPDFFVMQKPNLGQLLVGVGILYRLRSGIFSDDVSRYTAAALLDEGIGYAPKPLDFCGYVLKKESPVFSQVEKALASGEGKNEEAIRNQLSIIAAARKYRVEVAKRLVKQIEVIRERDNG